MFKKLSSGSDNGKMNVKHLKESALKNNGSWNNGITSDDLLQLFNHVSELEKQNKKMLDALKLFVTRVEMGEVKSKRTYAQFKEIIAECEK
jgi:hypothetical protein